MVPLKLTKLIGVLIVWCLLLRSGRLKSNESPKLPIIRGDMKLIIEIQNNEDSGNTPFTNDEQDEIVAKLQAIKNFVAKNFQLTAEQIAHVEERLAEAAEATERMGRKDWLLLFGGTIFNLIVTDTITPGVAGHIFTTVVQGLIHLFTGAGGPPQILA